MKSKNPTEENHAWESAAKRKLRATPESENRHGREDGNGLTLTLAETINVHALFVLVHC